MDGQSLIGGRFTVNMNKLQDKDLSDQDSREKLEHHLKSADFFNVDTFPYAEFVITKASVKKKIDDSHFTYRIDGNLTIKSITKNVGFDAAVSMAEMMEEEEIEERGHLQHVVNLSNDLFQLHLRLINSPDEGDYHQLYQSGALLEAELRQKGSEEDNLVSLFLAAIYGVWLLGLKKVQISDDTRQAVEQMSSLLALLSKYYAQVEAGEKELPE